MDGRNVLNGDPAKIHIIKRKGKVNALVEAIEGNPFFSEFQ